MLVSICSTDGAAAMTATPASDARDTWRSLSTSGGITIGTLFHIAEQHGFNTRAHRPTPADPAELERRRAARQARDDAETQNASWPGTTRPRSL
ncbi:hypothetical protein [Burkholderia cenocepacia]|uniref:hypothetical protein n=1 Tax=Burkholderia cenocepacia TaxID=95486 RepID=UPI001D0FB763|nr:hypothetical protein [Burkholderia cenocepacia]